MIWSFPDTNENPNLLTVSSGMDSKLVPPAEPPNSAPHPTSLRHELEGSPATGSLCLHTSPREED